MLVTCRQMQQIEQSAFDRGISADALMEEAGCGIANEVLRFFPQPGTLILYLGSGNNGGDALVAARELHQYGWQVHARLSGPVENLKPLPRLHFDALPQLRVLEAPADVHGMRHPIVQLDGLLGIGGSGEMRQPIRALAAEMNHLRSQVHAFTIAMDIPSGMNGDSGEPMPDCVQADLTVTVGFAKQGLVADVAVSYVGRLVLIPLPELHGAADGDMAALLTPSLLRPWLRRRDFEFHKGQAGRVGIIAGSPGFLGAAALTCGGALRAGAGLVTLLVKEDTYPLLSSRVSPEVMVKPVKDYREALEMRFDALALGPGLGFTSQSEVLEIIHQATVPTVIDADAITILASASDRTLHTAAGPRLLTPHPGEMQRLCPKQDAETRQSWAIRWSALHPGHYLLLKGARTIIQSANQPTLFNTTGHPGMATGGMGDVLTGVCAAFSAQGMTLHHAAALAAWACGRAAEIAALEMAQISVLPSDVIACLGRALRELE